MEIIFSAVQDPNDFSAPRVMKFNAPVEALHPHDDGVRVTLDDGHEIVLGPKFFDRRT